MAGALAEGQKQNTDILFDLTPEDNKTLQESELLQLVNFGQLSKPYVFPGMDGKQYTVHFAVLWEDDYLEILQRTTRHAADPILRSRVIRRLTVFKAIQRINDMDFSNPTDVVAKRLLWSLITKMSDVMVQVLDARYKEMELENNMTVMDAVTALAKTLEDTKPDSLKRAAAQAKVATDSSEFPKTAASEATVSPNSEAHFAPFSAGKEHENFMADIAARQQVSAASVEKVVEKQVILEEGQPLVSSPKKQ